MASEPDATSMLLRSTAGFRDLSDEQLRAIGSRAKVHYLLRSDVLVRQGTESNSVYVVVTGRFEVWIEGQNSAINEIGAGEPIGEIGFFAGVPRTATIVAARDSVVIELDRESFDDVARQVPSIYPTLLRTLARRLAAANARIVSEQRGMAARTIAVIAGGSRADPADLPRSLQQPDRTPQRPRPDAGRSARSLRRRGARCSDGVQLAQFHRAGTRARLLFRRRHPDRLDAQGDPASRPGPDRRVRRGARAAQSDGSVRVCYSPAVALPSGATAPTPLRRGRGYGRLARPTRRRTASPRIDRGRSRSQKPASIPHRAGDRLCGGRRRRFRPGSHRRLQGLRGARGHVRRSRRHQRRRGLSRRLRAADRVPKSWTSARATCSSSAGPSSA